MLPNNPKAAMRKRSKTRHERREAMAGGTCKSNFQRGRISGGAGARPATESRDRISDSQLEPLPDRGSKQGRPLSCTEMTLIMLTRATSTAMAAKE